MLILFIVVLIIIELFFNPFILAYLYLQTLVKIGLK